MAYFPAEFKLHKAAHYQKLVFFPATIIGISTFILNIGNFSCTLLKIFHTVAISIMQQATWCLSDYTTAFVFKYTGKFVHRCPNEDINSYTTQAQDEILQTKQNQLKLQSSPGISRTGCRKASSLSHKTSVGTWAE